MTVEKKDIEKLLSYFCLRQCMRGDMPRLKYTTKSDFWQFWRIPFLLNKFRLIKIMRNIAGKNGKKIATVTTFLYSCSNILIL